MLLVCMCAAGACTLAVKKADWLDRNSYITSVHILCVVYVSLSVGGDISMKAAAEANGGAYPFEPICVIVSIQAVACFAATCCVAMKSFAGADVSVPTARDTISFSVPGFIEIVNNLTLFHAIGVCPLAVFGVCRETVLVWNALIWMSVFRVSIGWRRAFCIAIVLAAVTWSQLGAAATKLGPAAAWPILVGMISASGNVATEHAMKSQRKTDIDIQNVFLYGFGFVIGIMYIVIFQPNNLGFAFFDGFTPLALQVICFESMSNIAVCRVLKYVDSVSKSVAATPRAAIIVFIGSLLTHTALSLDDVFTVMVLTVGVGAYVMQGPLHAP